MRLSPYAPMAWWARRDPAGREGDGGTCTDGGIRSVGVPADGSTDVPNATRATGAGEQLNTAAATVSGIAPPRRLRVLLFGAERAVP
ncbi:hypothetical protein OH781_14475 [Streptomyces sp. NBC_01550]|uniref:hypothetical protein n=1 Tax=Streptomyces sp. NBC_01550 TaxID=2975875 RepID=UPI00386CE2B1